MRESFSRIRKLFKSGPYFDWTLMLIVLLLAAIGLVMLFSISYYTGQTKNGSAFYYVKRQGMFLLVGLIFMFFFAKGPDYHFLYPLWLGGFVVVSLMMLAVIIPASPLSIELNGARRWIGYNGRAFFQPTELVKISAILTTAVALSSVGAVPDKKRGGRRAEVFRLPTLLSVVVLAGIPCGMVTAQNLSSGIIIAGTVFIMLFVASRENLPYAVIIMIGLLVAALLTASLASLDPGDPSQRILFLKSYQADRIRAWLNPEGTGSDLGWQVRQGLYAIGSGGLFGKGLGNGVQKLGPLPEASNDMIFASICEELGLFGAVCIIALFLLMIYRMVVIASNAPDRFGFLLVTGVTAQVALQVVLNIAVVTNMIPNTGVSLPFISYGGTSLIFLLLELGVVLNVSGARRGSGSKEKRRG